MLIRHVNMYFPEAEGEEDMKCFSNISIYMLQKRAAEFGYQILRFYIVYIYSLFCRINVKTEYCD